MKEGKGERNRGGTEKAAGEGVKGVDEGLQALSQRLVSLRTREQSKPVAWRPGGLEHPVGTLHALRGAAAWPAPHTSPALAAAAAGHGNLSAIPALQVAGLLCRTQSKTLESKPPQLHILSVFSFDHIIGIRKATPTEIATCT